MAAGPGGAGLEDSLRDNRPIGPRPFSPMPSSLTGAILQSGSPKD